MISVENELLQVKIKLKGAELSSVYSKDYQHEYMWQADPKFWAKSSPVLFPIVGGLKSDSYQYHGVWYRLSRHGFARDQTFTCTSHSSQEAVFCLESSEDTKAFYPFDFTFKIIYRLEGTRLSVSYEISNHGTDIMPYSVGAHPAFAIENDTYDTYSLVFDQIENLNIWPLNSEGIIKNQSVYFQDDGSKISLSKDLFYADALVFKHLKSKTIRLESSKNQHGLVFNISEFPYLGIWAAKDAPFVCIEPWCGIADHEDHNQDIMNKEGIALLEPFKTDIKTWWVDFF